MKTFRLKHIVLTVAISSITLFATAQQRYVDDVFSNVTTTSNITYGSNITSTGTSQNLLLDVYKPSGDTSNNRPLIIMAHEGSFLFGDKTDAYMVNYANRMAKKGYVVACITYRKGWVPNAAGTSEDNSRRIIPAAWRAIQDFKTAVRFFRKNAAVGGNTYGINPDMIVGGGFGAGAYLPINGQIIDETSEFTLASLNRKTDNDPTNDPDVGPYIDTTATGLGGIYDTQGGSAGYSFKLPLVLVYSGAIIDTLLFNVGTNPMVIAAHGDRDETTPYKTAIVNAQTAPGVLIPIIKVHGSYQITRILDNKGVNNFDNFNSDGYPQAMIPDTKFGSLNMYQKGVYTFVDETYMPWDCAQDDYTTTCQLYMDSVVGYSAPRIAYTLGLITIGIDEKYNTLAGVSIYPNPSGTDVQLTLSDKSITSFNVKVIDAMGRVIRTENNIPNETYRISRAGLATGIYFVQVSAGDKSTVQKLILY